MRFQPILRTSYINRLTVLLLNPIKSNHSFSPYNKFKHAKHSPNPKNDDIERPTTARFRNTIQNLHPEPHPQSATLVATSRIKKVSCAPSSPSFFRGGSSAINLSVAEGHIYITTHIHTHLSGGCPAAYCRRHIFHWLSPSRC